jgi:hypothetical protein
MQRLREERRNRGEQKEKNFRIDLECTAAGFSN